MEEQPDIHLKTPEEIEKDIKKEIKRMVRAGS